MDATNHIFDFWKFKILTESHVSHWFFKQKSIPVIKIIIKDTHQKCPCLKHMLHFYVIWSIKIEIDHIYNLSMCIIKFSYFAFLSSLVNFIALVSLILWKCFWKLESLLYGKSLLHFGINWPYIMRINCKEIETWHKWYEVILFEYCRCCMTNFLRYIYICNFSHAFDINWHAFWFINWEITHFCMLGQYSSNRLFRFVVLFILYFWQYINQNRKVSCDS